MAQIAPPCERTDSDEKKKAIGLAELLRVPHQIHSYRSGTSDITDFDEQIAFSCAREQLFSMRKGRIRLFSDLTSSINLAREVYFWTELFI